MVTTTPLNIILDLILDSWYILISMQNQNNMTVENAYSMIVSVTRQVKMTWEEHKVLEQAINVVLEELNKNVESEGDKKKQ